MSRFITVILLVILISSFALASCTTPTPSPTTTPSTTPSPEPAPEAGPTPENPIELKFSYHTPPKAGAVVNYFVPWTKAIEETAGGRVQITHYGSSTLCSSTEQYDGLISGLADMALVQPNKTAGRFPLSEINYLPLIAPDGETWAYAYYKLLEKYTFDTEWKDVHILSTIALAPVHYLGNKPVHSPADFKGLRIATFSTVESWIVENWDGVPVQIPTGDLYTALERGMVDGCFFNLSGVPAFSLHEVTKNRTMCGLIPKAWVLPINLSVWNNLPADIQKAFTDNSGADNSAKYSAADEASGPGIEKMIKAHDEKVGNNDWYVLSDEEKAEWREGVKPVWERWIKDVEAKNLPAREMVEDALSLTEEYSSK